MLGPAHRLAPAVRLYALLVALALLVAACTGQRAQVRQAAVAPVASPAPVAAASTPAAVPSPAAADAAPQDATGSFNAIREAYRQLTTQLFKEIAPRDLLVPAWRAVADEARREGLGGLDVSVYQSRGSDDIDAFTRELTALASGPGSGLDREKVGQAAIRGMAMAVGDSHTRFLTPEQGESQRRAADESQDVYSGIGVKISPAGEGITIAEVFPGSPADQAGLRPGDRIVRVNGRDVGSLDSSDISSQVRGPAGTEVRLTIQRSGEDLRELTVSRALVTPPTQPIVSSNMLDSDVGYMRIRSFPRRSGSLDIAREFDDQLARLLAQGARGVVLDLRDNPGGDPFTSVAVASNFVQQSRIFVTVNRDGRVTNYPAVSRPTVFHGPLAVLVNRNSASGAEVVASALQEYGAGYLVGARTCGCLSVGRQVNLGDSSSLVVTVERALTGRYERSLEGVGLDPDESVRGLATATSDPQRDRALAFLRERLH